MEEKRSVGRPPKGVIYQPKYFHIRIDLAKELETFPNQTLAVEEALEIYYNMQGKSEQWLLKRREELRRELESIDTTLRTKDREKREKEIKAEQYRVKEQQFAEMYEQIGDRTEKQLRIWSDIRLKRIGASFDEFLEYVNGRDK